MHRPTIPTIIHIPNKSNNNNNNNNNNSPPPSSTSSSSPPPSTKGIKQPITTTTTTSTRTGTRNRKSPISRLSIPWIHFIITFPPIFNIIAIFLLWFAITSPVPSSKTLSLSLLNLSSQKAAQKLSSITGAPLEAFDPFPSDSQLGFWIGLFGSCSRIEDNDNNNNNNPSSSSSSLESSSSSPSLLICQPSSPSPTYNPSITHLSNQLPILSQLTNSINPIPNSTKAIPAVSPIVFIFCFVFLVFGLGLGVWGNWPRYVVGLGGGGGMVGGGRVWNGVMVGHGNWLIQGDRGKWLLRLSTFLLSLSWILGFTASIALQAQFSGTAKYFNEGYAAFLANISIPDDSSSLSSSSSSLSSSTNGTGTGINGTGNGIDGTGEGENVGVGVLPPLLAAESGKMAFSLLWIAFSLMAFAGIATSTATSDYPTYVSSFPRNNNKTNNNNNGGRNDGGGGWNDGYSTNDGGYKGSMAV